MSNRKPIGSFKLPQGRYLVLPLVFWLVAAYLAWQEPVGSASVVGARQLLPYLSGGSFEPPKLEELLKQVSDATLWGLTPDGKPLPAPKSADSAPDISQQWVQWQLLAVTVRPNNGSLIIVQSPPDPPLTVRLGESLPDGSKLQSISLDRIVVKPQNKPLRTIVLYSE